MIKKFLNRKMLAIACLGLSSGVTLGVVLTLVQAWMTDAKIDLKTIGLISLVQFPYTFKFLWSPLMDRFHVPFLGRRQGWMFVAQIGMMISLYSLSFYDPKTDVYVITLVAAIVSFFGASHDIVCDAYLRDVFDDEDIGVGSAVSNNSSLVGYRFLAAVLGLALAQFMPWGEVFMILAGICAVGIVGTLLAPDPVRNIPSPKSLKDAVVLPFLNYLTRPGAIEILAFILLYKLGTNFASNLLTTFYLTIGYAKIEVASMGKLVGFTGVFVGGFLAGALLSRYSIRKCLLWFGVFQAVSILGFVVLNELIHRPDAHRLLLLGAAVGVENLATGMATIAYATFMLRLCDRRFSATQYALLSSFMGIPRVFIPGWAGYVAAPFGWTNFFIFSTVLCVPGLLLVYFRAKKWEESLPTYE